ncbi:hypothetical protein HYT23_01340 [Candidatus Pacearchaeota archaeon]|nr:hypothetical protein [Candidatus Pacearchaeota archaeon]
MANSAKKEKLFDKILRDIEEVKIQGARNIAKAALKAYLIFPSKDSRERLVSARPTEPMLQNILDKAPKFSNKKLFAHFDIAQGRINNSVFKIIKNGDKIFTHCHSTNVVNSLIFSKKKGKRFQIYNTETRPLFQGRKTSKELSKAGIRVTQFVDSAFATAIEKDSKNDKIFANKVFIGADALLKEGIINKIGSKIIAELAFYHKIPFYVVADSWKYTNKKIPIEQRKINEVWNKAPKNIKIKNPAFEFVPKKYITKIISEYGTLSYSDFVKKIKK